MVSLSYPYMPMWLLALLFFLGLLVAREAGSHARRRWPPSRTAGGKEDDDAFAMTSVLGLLALLIGFTFSIGLSRYESRRELVVKEANALGTTWLRADLLEDGARTRLQDVLRRYVDARIAFGAAAGLAEEQREQRRTEALQAELWSTVVAAVAPFRDTPRASLLVATTNESIDLAAERHATRQSHIPPRILRMLVVFALLGAAMIGYERSAQRKSTTMLFVLLTLAVSLVIDLDRPSTGLVNVPQEPMLGLRESMGAAPAVP